MIEYDVDLTLPKQELDLFLTFPNGTIISKLNESYNKNYNIKLGSINEISFDIPIQIELNHELINNPNINKIKERFLIKALRGTQEEWFIITEIKETADDKGDKKSIKAYCLGYELKDKILRNYSAESKNATQLLTEVLSSTIWNIGYIDASFDLLYRSIQITSNSVLDVVIQISETFGALIIFNTIDREINFYNPENYGINKGLRISYENYLKSLGRDSNADEMVTRYIVEGKDGLSIQTINPTGANYIEDFSFFVYPFARDVEGNVLAHSDYGMSDGLCHAILDYNILVESKSEEFNGYLTQKTNLQISLTTKENELVVLNDGMATILDNIDVALANNQDTTSLLLQKTTKQTEINNKQAEIDSINSQITIINTNITNLRTLLSIESNFTPEQIIERNQYIIQKEWVDTNYIDAEDLYNDAIKRFELLRTPQTSIQIDIVNFLNIVTEQKNWDKLSIGDIVTVEYKRFNLEVEEKITEIDINYEDNFIKLTVANNKNILNDEEKFLKDLNNAINTSTTVSMDKYKWNKVITIENDIENLLNNIWDANARNIKAGVNESVEISKRGILIKDPNDPSNYLVAQHGILSITNDGGNTWKQAIRPDGIIGSRIIGQILAGENLVITTGNGDFLVDETGVTIKGGSLNIIDGLPPSQISQEYTNYIETQINEANTAIDQLEIDVGNMLSDSKITALEANTLEVSLVQVLKESTDIINIATSLGITTEKNNYSNALTALQIELNNWINQANYPINITIVQRDNILSKFEMVQDTKSKLINKIGLIREQNAKDYVDQQKDELNNAINGLENDINDFNSDLILTLAEANSLKISLNNVNSESTDIINIATSLGITTEKNNYSNALDTLTNYLNTNWLGKTYPLAITSTQRTNVTNYFKNVENKKSILINKIMAVREQNARDASVGKGELINGVKIDAPHGLVITRSDNKTRSIFNATEGIKIQTRLSIIAGEETSYTWSNAIDKFYVDNNGNLKLKGFVEIGSNNAIFKADNNGIYLGNSTFNYAPFRVDLNGKVTATGADIQGKIDCSDLYINGSNILTTLDQISGSSVEGSTIQNLNANNITAGTINADRINTTNLYAERIYQPGNSNNYLSIYNATWGSSLNFLKNGSQELFTIADQGDNTVALLLGGSYLLRSPIDENNTTTVHGTWDFNSATVENLNVVAKFG